MLVQPIAQQAQPPLLFGSCGVGLAVWAFIALPF